MIRALRRFVLLSFVSLAACAAPPPPEFAIYTAAFDRTREAARAIVGVFEPIERETRAPAPGAFDPDAAAYLVAGAPVGASAQITRGFDAIADYNETLAAYAAGASIETLRPKITAFAADARLLGLAVGSPGAGAVADAAVEGVVAIGGALLAVSDRNAFAEVVARRSGAVDAFLAEVRAATPIMFETARAHVNRLKLEALTAGRDAEVAKLDEALTDFRDALAVWVLTIDRTRGAVAALEDAVANQNDAGLTLQTVSFWTAEIDRYAAQVSFAANRISRRF